MQGSGGCGCAAPRLCVRPCGAKSAIQWVSHLIRTHCCAGHVSCPLHSSVLPFDGAISSNPAAQAQAVREAPGCYEHRVEEAL